MFTGVGHTLRGKSDATSLAQDIQAHPAVGLPPPPTPPPQKKKAAASSKGKQAKKS